MTRRWFIPMRWPGLSIRSTVVLGIGIAVLAPTLALWHVEQGLTRTAQEPLIAQNRQAVLVMTAAALVEPLWTLDDQATRLTALRALDEPSVNSLRLVETRPLALEFRNHRLVDTLTDAMAHFGVHPHELEIELAESVLMTDTDTTRLIVARLRALGLPLAVDDFGTGYSSLAYLKHLRPSKIKIDRSFIRDLPGNEDDRVIVQALAQLAQTLGIRVVAEGVENVAQREFLQRIGCAALQGYLISRPQPVEGFERFVRVRLESFDRVVEPENT